MFNSLRRSAMRAVSWMYAFAHEVSMAQVYASQHSTNYRRQVHQAKGKVSRHLRLNQSAFSTQARRGLNSLDRVPKAGVWLRG